MSSSLRLAGFTGQSFDELRYGSLSKNGLNNQVVAGASARHGGRLDAAAAAARRRRRMGADTIRSAPTYWMSSTSSSSSSSSSSWSSPSLLQLPLRAIHALLLQLPEEGDEQALLIGVMLQGLQRHVSKNKSIKDWVSETFLGCATHLFLRNVVEQNLCEYLIYVMACGGQSMDKLCTVVPPQASLAPIHRRRRNARVGWNSWKILTNNMGWDARDGRYLL